MLNILVADDHQQFRAGICACLRALGHQVSEARDGREGILAVADQRFDVIFTDILMPTMDGIELLKVLRAKNVGAKLIAMTGGGLTGAELILDMCDKLGADRVIEKPISMEQLKKALEF